MCFTRAAAYLSRERASCASVSNENATRVPSWVPAGFSPRSVSTHLFLPARERVVHSRRGALEPRPRGGVERVGAHFRGVVARRSTRLEAHAGAGVVRSDARRGTPSGFAVSAARVDWTRGRKRRRAAESAARGIARARSAFIRRWTNSREKTCVQALAAWRDRRCGIARNRSIALYRSSKCLIYKPKSSFLNFRGHLSG